MGEGVVHREGAGWGINTTQAPCQGRTSQAVSRVGLAMPPGV